MYDIVVLSLNRVVILTDAALRLLILVILLRALLLLRSVLLGDLVLHDVDRRTLELLSNLLLLALPGVFYPVARVPLALADGFFLDADQFGHELQVKQSIVKHLEVLHLLGLRLFHLNVQPLVRAHLFLLDEIGGRFNQTDFVV